MYSADRRKALDSWHLTLNQLLQTRVCRVVRSPASDTFTLINQTTFEQYVVRISSVSRRRARSLARIYVLCCSAAASGFRAIRSFNNGDDAADSVVRDDGADAVPGDIKSSRESTWESRFHLKTTYSGLSWRRMCICAWAAMLWTSRTTKLKNMSTRRAQTLAKASVTIILAVT